MELLWRDLRFAVRILARNPGFTGLAVCAMAFGIAATTLLFSVVNATLLKSLPYRDPERLVMLWDQLRAFRLLEFPTSYGIFQDYRDRGNVFEQIEAFVPMTATLVLPERPERISALRVTAGMLPMLGAGVIAGRSIERGEDRRGADRTALLSYGLWMRRFGGDRNALGQTIQLDNKVYTVGGVLDPGFRFRLAGGLPPDVVTPLPLDQDPERRRGSLRVLARMRPGVTIEQARRTMGDIAGQLSKEYRVYQGPNGEDAGYTATVAPLREQLYGAASQSVLLLFGATLTLLAITCANVAYLFLEWRAKRDAEFQIREWVGATQGTLWRQLITESLLVSLTGGVVGLAVVSVGAQVLFPHLPNELSALDDLRVDATVFLFAGLLCAATGTLFGLLPGNRRKGSTRVTREGLRPWLVVAQTSMSLVLLVIATLLARSMAKLESVDVGLRRDRILAAQVSFPTPSRMDTTPVRAYWTRLLEWSATQPDFEGVALSSLLPFAAGTGGDPFSIEGRAFQSSGATPQMARYQVVSADYFTLLRIPLRAGRFFAASDDKPENSVAIVSEALAKAFWPNESPLGKRILLGAPRPGGRWMTIVGVVADVKNTGVENRPLPHIYETIGQAPVLHTTLLIGTRLEAEQLAGAIEARMASFDRTTPVYGISTMEQRIARTMEQPRFRSRLFSAFGLLAFLLAAFGIYSVTAFRVAQRMREIGIRMALGAAPGEIRRWVAGSALKPVAIGLAAGLLIALAISGALSRFLFEVSPRDGLAYAVSVGSFLLVAWIASLLPAWRAARQAPIRTLRQE
ncbi:MAG: ABC transporter permease [Bryobacterales bacterium]|nr:ABC transporter permease [Bryobacterales bacterium]